MTSRFVSRARPATPTIGAREQGPAALDCPDRAGGQEEARQVQERESDRPEHAVGEQAGGPQGESARRRRRHPAREQPGEQEPADDVLERGHFEDPGGTPKAEHVGGPAEENAPGAERGQVHGAVDQRIAAERIEGALSVELTVVACPRRVVEVRHRAHRRRFVVVPRGKADEGGEAGYPGDKIALQRPGKG